MNYPLAFDGYNVCSCFKRTGDSKIKLLGCGTLSLHLRCWGRRTLGELRSLLIFLGRCRSGGAGSYIYKYIKMWILFSVCLPLEMSHSCWRKQLKALGIFTMTRLQDSWKTLSISSFCSLGWMLEIGDEKCLWPTDQLLLKWIVPKGLFLLI